MKTLISFVLLACCFTGTHAQFLKKIKQKAEQAVDKSIDKKIDGDTEKKEEAPQQPAEETSSTASSATGKKDLKVYSKFDFVPGSSILYFDNFEKDNVGETPAGWITSNSAEVVTIEGLEGKWLKMAPVSSRHIVRNKKQSWGNNFTIEFDLLIVKDGYDPRMGITLINTAGKMVTDETLLMNYSPVLRFESIIVAGGKSRISLVNKDNKTVSDNMNGELAYTNSTPVHISICVQGKRFRMWWNEKKLYDMGAINEEYLPNQFGFEFGSVGGSDFYISNIRVAKEVPDTRAKFEQGKIVSNLLFYAGTAELRSESMGALLDVSKVMKESTSPVKIVGHTDSDGDDASNQKLSLARAEAVKSILVKQYAIDESLLATEGRGEAQPVADNKNAEGKAQNRRVEFIFKAEADVYTKPAGVSAGDAKPAAVSKPGAKTTSAAAGEASVQLQGKTLTASLPFAQFMKSSDNRYVFLASKEEGNSKENFFKIELETAGLQLKPGTFNFKETNQKNPLYGTKKFPEIKKTEAVLYYGGAAKPYVHQFSPIIASGHMANYVSESLERKLPAASPNCKLVIETLEAGKASGYFVFGLMNTGLKPITKGDAMTETFTEGFAGEVKCVFANVPVF
jgi:outer membrane protein OmpA-like peptidoglycan-associated protein